jgi:hypothetical protein
MANDIHRVVQDSTHRDHWSAIVLVDPKEDEMPPAAIAADMEGVEAGGDLGSSSHPENFRPLSESTQRFIDQVQICFRLGDAEAAHGPAIDLANVILRGS